MSTFCRVTVSPSDLKKHQKNIAKAQRLCKKGQRYMSKASALANGGMSSDPQCPSNCMFDGSVCVCNNWMSQKVGDPQCAPGCFPLGVDCVCGNN